MTTTDAFLPPWPTTWSAPKSCDLTLVTIPLAPGQSITVLTQLWLDYPFGPMTCHPPGFSGYGQTYLAPTPTRCPRGWKLAGDVFSSDGGGNGEQTTFWRCCSTNWVYQFDGAAPLCESSVPSSTRVISALLSGTEGERFITAPPLNAIALPVFAAYVPGRSVVQETGSAITGSASGGSGGDNVLRNSAGVSTGVMSTSISTTTSSNSGSGGGGGGGGLTSTAKIGIAVGVVITVLLLFIIITYFFIRRRRRRRRRQLANLTDEACEHTDKPELPGQGVEPHRAELDAADKTKSQAGAGEIYELPSPDGSIEKTSVKKLSKMKPFAAELPAAPLLPPPPAELPTPLPKETSVLDVVSPRAVVVPARKPVRNSIPMPETETASIAMDTQSHAVASGTHTPMGTETLSITAADTQSHTIGSGTHTPMGTETELLPPSIPQSTASSSAQPREGIVDLELQWLEEEEARLRERKERLLAERSRRKM